VDRANSWYKNDALMFPFDPIAKEIFGVRFYVFVIVTENQVKADAPTMFWH